MRCERNGRARRLATRVALPMVADFTALDEFGRDRRDHNVTAVRAAHGCGKGTDSGELRPIFMKLHVTASFCSPVHAF